MKHDNSVAAVAAVIRAGDAVTWAARNIPSGGTNAPASLTSSQLKAIFTCADTNWSQVGGANAPIHAFLPQSGSGTLSWPLALGGGTTPITPGHHHPGNQKRNLQPAQRRDMAAP